MRDVAQKKPTENHKRQRNIDSHRTANHPIYPSASLSNNNILIQHKPLCLCDGGCLQCQKNLPIQTKLTIGQPNDKYEQEADRVADTVMRMPEPQVQRQPEEEEEHPTANISLFPL